MVWIQEIVFKNFPNCPMAYIQNICNFSRRTTSSFLCHFQHILFQLYCSCSHWSSWPSTLFHSDFDKYFRINVMYNRLTSDKLPSASRYMKCLSVIAGVRIHYDRGFQYERHVIQANVTQSKQMRLMRRIQMKSITM